MAMAIVELVTDINETQRHNIERIKHLAQYQWNGEFHGLKDTGKLATQEELKKRLIIDDN